MVAAHRCRGMRRFFVKLELTIAADYQVVAVGAVEAEDIEDNQTLGGVDHLTNPEKRFAFGDAEEFGGSRIGDGGVDFFVGVSELDTVLAFERGEKRSGLQRRGEQAGELCRG